ncbi:unnamed protein product [Caenorhabditis sp. 36 PRJEB53466]|nr:unnamed protein product [Caenorhabditis sp. 36 PRJEB53466]
MRKVPRKCESVTLVDSLNTEEEVNEILDYFEFHEDSKLILHTSEVDPHEKIFQVGKHVYIRNANRFIIDDVKKFNCKHLHIENHQMDIATWIRNWKESSDSTGLVLLEIRVQGALDSILDGLDPKPWNPTRRPRVFPLNSMDCGRFLDVQRADGMIASFGINQGPETVSKLFMCIWH